MTNFFQVVGFDPLQVSEYVTQTVTGGGPTSSIAIVDNGATLSLTPSGTSSIVDNGDTLTITA